MIWALAVSLIGGACALFAFVRAAKMGHFNNIEDVKYQMFRNDEQQRRSKKE